jgi:predicted transcriptional regulator
MEIRVTAELTGAMLRQRILDRWGSRENLRQEADDGDAEAREDLFTLERIEEDASRSEATFERTTITSLEADELARLTPSRLELLDRIAASEEPPSISQLARVTGRDKKNISEDVSLLEELGLVESLTDGRTKRVRVRGAKMTIELSPDEVVTAGP